MNQIKTYEIQTFTYSKFFFNMVTNTWEFAKTTIDEDVLLKQMRFWNVSMYRGMKLAECFNILISKWNVFEEVGSKNRNKIIYSVIEKI